MAFNGKRLKDLRDAKGWSQQDLADRSKISRQQISRYERDEVEPSATAIANLAVALDIPSDYLLGVTDDIGVGARHLSIDDIELLRLYRSGKLMEVIDFIVQQSKKRS